MIHLAAAEQPEPRHPPANTSKISSRRNRAKAVEQSGAEARGEGAGGRGRGQLVGEHEVRERGKERERGIFKQAGSWTPENQATSVQL